VTKPAIRKTRGAEQGYILLTLILFVALLAIAAAVTLPELAFQVKRDREEEMIHRGAQYARAVRRYYKKFGRYPTRIEELEQTNNIRFLRRKYKDPITGKDFRLLHYGEVPTGMGGLGMVAGMAGMAGPGGLGARTGAGGVAMNAAQMQAGMAAMATAMTANMPGGAGANAPFGSSPAGNQPGATADNSDNSDNNDNSSGGNGKTAQKTGFAGSGDKLAGQVFGGGPIIGVTSLSKDQTIREFANKNHYNQWNFIYDPSLDRGALITGPAQPLQNLGLGGQPGMQGVNGANGINGMNGQTQNGFGQSGFGQSGFGQNGFGQSGGTQPQQPSQPQQQQQQ